MLIAALSDQHGFLPEIPPCDLVIVAGDVCPDRIGPCWAFHYPELQRDWFNQRARPWLAAAPGTHKVLTWGNHDWCGEHGGWDADAPDVGLTTDLQIVIDQETRVPTSDGHVLRVWATPWSNQFMRWAFMQPPAALEEVYARVPSGIDVLVSHQPPYGYGDETWYPDTGRCMHLGSRELLRAIERVRPRLVICGHIHGGFGTYEHDGVAIYNVSVVDEAYRLVRAPTLIRI